MFTLQKKAQNCPDCPTFIKIKFFLIDENFLLTKMSLVDSEKQKLVI